jgi:hypothetical protein
MRKGDNILGPTQWLSPWLSPVKEAATLQSEYQQKQLKYTLEVICWLLSLTTQESEDSLSHQNQIIGILGNENRRVETQLALCHSFMLEVREFFCHKLPRYIMVQQHLPPNLIVSSKMVDPNSLSPSNIRQIDMDFFLPK